MNAIAGTTVSRTLLWLYSIFKKTLQNKKTVTNWSMYITFFSQQTQKSQLPIFHLENVIELRIKGAHHTSIEWKFWKIWWMGQTLAHFHWQYICLIESTVMKSKREIYESKKNSSQRLKLRKNKKNPTEQNGNKRNKQYETRRREREYAWMWNDEYIPFTILFY